MTVFLVIYAVITYVIALVVIGTVVYHERARLNVMRWLVCVFTWSLSPIVVPLTTLMIWFVLNEPDAVTHEEFL